MNITFYFSIGYRTPLERKLIDCPSFTTNVTNHSLKLAQECIGDSVAGLLCPTNLPNHVIPGAVRIDNTKSEDPLDADIEAIISHAQSSRSTWIIILRPLFGWIYKARLTTLLAALEKTTASQVFSTVQISSLGHPLWNCRFVPNGCEYGSFATPQPPAHYLGKVTRQNFDGAQALWTTDYARSQDLPALYKNDHALIALRTDFLQTKKEDSSPAQEIIHCDQKIDEESPWYFRLPIHELKDHGALNFTNIEESFKK